MKWIQFSVVASVISLSLAGNASAVTINIDLEAPGTAIAHVGDDGVLSTSGGTVWNSILTGTDTENLDDEFGIASMVNIRFGGTFAQSFSDIGINDLQDSGSSSSIELYGLNAAEVYSLAVYVGAAGGFGLTHGGGASGFFFADPGADGWALPGSVSIPNGSGGDYFLISNLTPADLGGGDFGFSFGLDGTVTAIQIVVTPVPEPSSLLFVGLGIIGLTTIGRRNFRGGI